MEDLFFILLLVSFFLVILGLFSPKTSLFWVKSNQSRGKSTLIYGVATIIFFVAYGETANSNKDKSKNNSALITTGNSTIGDSIKGDLILNTNNAVEFINGYTENLNKGNKIDWVYSSPLTTESFRNELKRILDEAHKTDPNVGLDFDPILDAQDSPDKGFELESHDQKTNYLTVRGIDWPEFKVTMRIKQENGTWLVDGCGVVNIPVDKRGSR